MKTKWFAISIFLVLLVVLTSCSVSLQYKYPDEGIWYCEALQMYLDMETSKGYTERNGVQEPVFALIDYGNGITICYCEDERSEDYEDCERFSATFRYRNGVFELTEKQTGEVYQFVEIEK